MRYVSETARRLHKWCADRWNALSTTTPRSVRIVLSVELLEDRTLPSVAVPSYEIFHPATLTHSDDPSNYGYVPAQVRHAYGLDAVSFNGIVGDGEGQTIAIIDAYDNPQFVNSIDPSFASSDLHQFDLALGIPDPPSFRKVSETGSTTDLPEQDAGWDAEIALDVEWSHALAPKANILLVEAALPTYYDLVQQAVVYAAQQPGVSAISMSFGSGEFPEQLSLDSSFTTPAGHTGVTFLASSGDSGAPAGYPAASPNVLAVGGTSLYINGNNYAFEFGWDGSTGGPSSYESLPIYQDATLGGGTRGNPDVAFVADPATAVAVYDTVNNSADYPWWGLGGTSVSSPCWAAMIAITNQGRVAAGETPLDGPSETLPDIYSLPASDFHDITFGNNGYDAGPGYDFVTGRGSPIANKLILDLVSIVDPPTISAIPNLVVAPGSSLTSIPFTIGDQGTDLSSLKVMASSSDTTVLPDSDIVLGGSGANRTISIFAPAGVPGSTTITVTVAANPTARTTTTFTLIVDNSPVLPAIANDSITHGMTPAPISLNAADADPTDTLVYSVKFHDPLADLEAQLALFTVDGYFNYRGQNEKYLLSGNGGNPSGGGWYMLMPNGNLLTWNGSLATSSLVAALPTSVYGNPALLTDTTGVPLATAGVNPLYDLKLKYGLAQPASCFNYRGADEYYLRSNNNSNAASGGWYVLTANNDLLAWNGALQTSTLIANLNSYGDVYANPALLNMACLPTTTGVTATNDPATGGMLTVTPAPGFDRNVQVTVSVTDSRLTATRTFTLNVNDTPPTLPVIDPVTIAHNATTSFKLGASSNGPLTYAISVGGSPLYDLSSQDGLNSADQGFDYRGFNERYFQSSNGSNPNGGGWYTLVPSGKLYAWNWAGLAVTLAQTPVADLSAAGVYANPSLLYRAVLPTAFTKQGSLYDVKAQFGLNMSDACFDYRGGDERYFESSNGSNSAGGGWYLLMPNGMLYAWNGADLNSSIAGGAVADMSGYGVYANPGLLYNAQPEFSSNDPAFITKTLYGLDTADAAFNYRGAGEKYFLSSNGSNPAGSGYYVLMPTGLLYAWNWSGLDATVAQAPVTDLSTQGVYGHTALLFASTGQAPPVTATVDASGNVTLTPNTAFVGTVRVNVTVSDGAETTMKSFPVNVTNQAPVLPTINPVNIASAVGSKSIDLGATDSDALQFAASISGFNPLYDTKIRLGLDTAEIAWIFNYYGEGERYFQSSNGSTSADGGYYVMMPNGMLYAWLGSLGATIAQTPVADLSATNAYKNPVLLFDAKAPNLASFSNENSGGTLTLAWPAGFTGSFTVTVYVTDGAAETQQMFQVTVS